MSDRRLYPLTATAVIGKPVLNDRDYQVMYTGPAARRAKDFARFTVIRRDGQPTPSGVASVFVAPGEAAVLPLVRDGGPLVIVFTGDTQNLDGPAVRVMIARSSPQITALADAAMDNTEAALKPTAEPEGPTDAEVLGAVADAYRQPAAEQEPELPADRTTAPDAPTTTGETRQERERRRGRGRRVREAIEAAHAVEGAGPTPVLILSPARCAILRAALGSLVKAVASDLDEAKRVGLSCGMHACGDPGGTIINIVGQIHGEIPPP